MHRALANYLIPLLVALAVGVILFGITDYSNYWRSETKLGLGIWSISALVTAFVLRKCWPNYAAGIFLLLSFLVLIVGAGLPQIVSAMLFFISCYAVGRIICHWLQPADRDWRLFASSIAIGAVFWIFVFSGLVHWPVNFAWLHLALLLIPILIVLVNPLWRAWLNVRSDCVAINQHCASLPYLPFVIACTLIGYIATHIFVPTVMWDDNVYHLSYWVQLDHHQKYLFDVNSQIWSLAPFAGDLVHAVISLVAGKDAKGAYNLLLMAGLVVAFWQLTKVWLSRSSDRLLLLMLFVSTPMLSNLLLGLQTDLLLALLTVAGVYIASARELTWVSIIGVICVAALCTATKLPAVLISFSLLVVLCLYLWQQRRQFTFPSKWVLGKSLLILSAAAVVAIQSYGYAYLVTGNPVFPLYNGIFASTYAPPTNFVDNRYIPNVSWDAWQGIFFATGKYFESQKYVAGFQYYLLFPLSVLVMLLNRANWRQFPMLLPLLIYGVPLFLTIHYWRYFYAVLPLASLCLAALLVACKAGSASGHIVRVGFVVVLLLNLWFLTGVSGFSGMGPAVFLSQERQEFIVQRAAPEQLANQWLNRRDPQARVLFDFSRAYGASLAGTPYYNAWYSPKISSEIHTWQDAKHVEKSLVGWGVEYIYWDEYAAGRDESAPRKALANYIERELALGNLTLAHKIGVLLIYQQSIARRSSESID